MTFRILNKFSNRFLLKLVLLTSDRSNNRWIFFYYFRVNANSEEKLVHPNHMVYQKMEALVNHMLDAETGVPIKTVKSFLSKVPSVFTGQDLIAWIMKSLDMSDLCELIAFHVSYIILC